MLTKIKNYFFNNFSTHSITLFDLTIFFRQFATLISTGIPIIQSCETLEKSQTKTQLRLLIRAIKKEIASGKSLSQTLASHPRYFNQLTWQLLKIGEHTGRLDMMLNLIAEYQEKKLAFHKRIKRALFYPIFISITALSMTLVMLIFVIPKFEELFQTTQIKLPLMTIWIFYISAFIKKYFLIFIMLLAISFLLLFNFKKLNLTQWLLMLPFIKTINQKFIICQFARCVALTFAAGLPITQSLHLAASISENVEFVTTMAKLRSKISSGVMLHRAMMIYSFFPALMIQMVKIGEESGKLAEMLDKIADFFEADLDHLLTFLSELLEPLIMLVLGVLIGGLVIGMYLPIFKLGNTF